MTLLLLIVILAFIGALPSWRYSADWGYRPSGLIGAAILILVLVALLNRAPI